MCVDVLPVLAPVPRCSANVSGTGVYSGNLPFPDTHSTQRPCTAILPFIAVPISRVLFIWVNRIHKSYGKSFEGLSELTEEPGMGACVL